jgi:hypothetical protein
MSDKKVDSGALEHIQLQNTDNITFLNNCILKINFFIEEQKK